MERVDAQINLFTYKLNNRMHSTARAPQSKCTAYAGIKKDQKKTFSQLAIEAATKDGSWG